MKKKNEEKRQAASFDQSLEVLFGLESDLTDEELDRRATNLAGLTLQELQADVHKQLFEYANHNYRTLDRAVPENLEKSAQGTAASDGSGRQSQSGSTFCGNFGWKFPRHSKGQVVGDFGRRLHPGQAQQPQFAFRNKKELSAADNALLQSEQDDVDSSDD